MSRSAPPALDQEARRNLQFIRDTMRGAGAFTAVPGWGGLTMGLVALPAAWLAHRRPVAGAWLSVWLLAAALAAPIGLVSMWGKARASRLSWNAGSGRGFLLSFTPPLVAGALLTPVLYRAGLAGRLPGVWLLLYGTGIVTGGSHSIRVIPILGLLFMVTGVLSFLTPTAWGDAWMALGFGGLQILFGLWIARRHGG